MSGSQRKQNQKKKKAMADVLKIKELREETGISIGECKRALDKTGGNLEKAKAVLKKMGAEFAVEKRGRDTNTGVIQSYIHSNRKIGVLMELRCETDFVAKNKEFQNLGHEICMQIAAVCPESKEALLESAWIKDEGRKIKDLISENIAKLGENIVVERFVFYRV